MQHTAKWDKRFMDLALNVASWSKDPGHKVGCVVVDDDKNQLSSGFNGFPRGITDALHRLLDRDEKLLIIVHAEANAVAAAARNGHSLKGSTAYVTLRPCCQCASLLIQAGVKNVVVPKSENDGVWSDNLNKAERLLIEAGISYERI